MFGTSVNSMPGWLVTIAPSLIGVPVAFTPGLVPHWDVLTVLAPEPAGPVGTAPAAWVAEPPHPPSEIDPATRLAAATMRSREAR